MDFIRKSLTWLSVGVILVSCTQNDTVVITSFPIEKSIKYSDYDTYDIIDPAGIVVSDSYLFLLGLKSEPIFQQYELQEMKYVRSFGIRGRGPDEFMESPSMYVSHNPEKFYIYRFWEKSVTAYQILKDGDLAQENIFIINKGGTMNQFHIIKDSLIVYNLVPQIGIVKIELSEDDRFSKIEFDKNKDYPEDFFHPNYGTLSVNDRYIVYAYKYRKQIDIYDIDNMKLKTRLLAYGHREEITISEQSKGYYYDVYTTNNFIYAYYVNPDSGDSKNKYFIEVFDYSGTPIIRYNIGISLGGLFAVSSKDDVMYSFSWELEKILKFDL